MYAAPMRHADDHDGLETTLPQSLHDAWEESLASWDESRGTRRLWERDASLWTGGEEGSWLGWLDLPESPRPPSAEVAGFVDRLRGEFSSVLVLGMGGSSLGAEALVRSASPSPEAPGFRVLDSTDPDQIHDTLAGLDLERTLVFVASKSGGTLETRLLAEELERRLAETLGPTPARQLVAITDPDSALARLAEGRGWRHTFLGRADVGGRFSVLSPFGLAPAAAAGVNVEAVLVAAVEMARRCRSATGAENPGVRLGTLLGAAAAAGRDKVTLFCRAADLPFAAWLEQLLAESTGKGGRGLIPVLEGADAGAAEVYGADRLFVCLGEEPAAEGLGDVGHPVLRLPGVDRLTLGGELFRWEMATAVAGSRLGLDPFDQPDVEAAKRITRELMQEVERRGSLRHGRPVLEEDGIALLSPLPPGVEAPQGDGLSSLLQRHLDRLQPGRSYLALLAYLDARAEEPLRRLCLSVRDRRRVAVCFGLGPRYLHSTGQLFKGGPEGGVFVVLSAEPKHDLDVPAHSYSFGEVVLAQASGDVGALVERGRPVLHLNLRGERAQSVEKFCRRLEELL